jgi:hypothetical protein
MMDCRRMTKVQRNQMKMDEGSGWGFCGRDLMSGRVDVLDSHDELRCLDGDREDFLYGEAGPTLVVSDDESSRSMSS